jgi:PPOX class probable F420-dependent enzyme
VTTMDESEWRAFLSAGTRTAKLATTRQDGRPHVAPVWFLLEGDEIVFNTGRDTVKGRTIARDRRVAICVDDDRPPQRGRGRAGRARRDRAGRRAEGRRRLTPVAEVHPQRGAPGRSMAEHAGRSRAYDAPVTRGRSLHATVSAPTKLRAQGVRARNARCVNTFRAHWRAERLCCTLVHMTRTGSTTPFAPTIRGIGCVTGYGWGREVLRSGMRSGMSSIAPISGSDERLPEKVWGSWIPEGGHVEDGASRYGRALRYSAREAVRDAKEHGWVPGDNVGLIHCVVLGEVDLWKDFYLQNGGDLRVRQYLQLMPSTPLSLFMQEEGFHGPVMSVQAMCASGGAGILTARNWLQTGWASDVVIVATDISGTAENIVHFHRLGVGFCHGPSEEICKPFQKDSRGFMLGEASVGFVLSERGDTGYARVRGGAMTHDGFHVTSVEPSHVLVTRRSSAASPTPGSVRTTSPTSPPTGPARVSATPPSRPCSRTSAPIAPASTP